MDCNENTPMILTEKQRERYSRLLSLKNIGEDKMKAIMGTTVTVVGAGGLGSPALRLLTAVGFGKVRIIDRDIVELSNIQRQTIYNTEDIGKPKAEVAVANLALMNPEVDFEAYSVSLQEDNAIELLQGSDIILDGLDSFAARRVVNKASLKLEVPYIFAGAVEYYANLSTFIPHETACFNCIMGDAKDNPENSCANVGVTPTLLSLASAIEVNEAIFIATGRKPQLANRLLTIDSESLSFETFDISRSNTCSVCSGSIIIDDKKKELHVTHLCSQSFNITPPSLKTMNLEKMANILSRTYSVKLVGKSLIIKTSEDEKVTLMTSGNAIVKGVNTAGDAIELYQTIMGKLSSKE